MPACEEIVVVDPVIVTQCLDGLGIKSPARCDSERIGLGQSNLTYPGARTDPNTPG